MELQPFRDRLIVEVLAGEEATASGIVLPDTAKEKPQRGHVLAVGPGERSEHTGELIPMDVAEGDEIIFSKYGGTELKLDAAIGDVLILRQSDVLAKVAGATASSNGKGKRELAGAAA
jgi:chaperonin GroES